MNFLLKLCELVYVNVVYYDGEKIGYIRKEYFN